MSVDFTILVWNIYMLAVPEQKTVFQKELSLLLKSSQSVPGIYIRDTMEHLAIHFSMVCGYGMPERQKQTHRSLCQVQHVYLPSSYLALGMTRHVYLDPTIHAWTSCIDFEGKLAQRENFTRDAVDMPPRLLG